jgi:hypothetical protein
MRGVDVPRRFRIIVESFADLTNSDFKDCFADKGPCPHRVKKLFFRDELTGTPNEIIEHCERLWTKFDHL